MTMKRKSMLIGFGAALIACGVLVMAQVPWFFIRSEVDGAALLQKEQAALAVSSQGTPNAWTTPSSALPLADASQGAYEVLPLSDTVAPLQRSPRPGALIGIVRIPALSLDAPLLQGTGDSVLSVAAGHLPDSALPGELGTAVVAAHNATWFHHINELGKGDLIDLATAYGSFTFRVTGTAIVAQDSALSEAPYPSLVLETCYPLNALYLTPYRYIVYAKLASSVIRREGMSALQTSKTVSYDGRIPSALWQEGLTLATNPIPMGTLSYVGSPSFAYEESNAPLSGANTLQELYAGWLHASSLRNESQLHFLLPHFHSLNPLYGVALDTIHYDSALAITLTVHGSTLVAASGQIKVQVGRALYNVHLYATVRGNEMTLRQLQFTR